MSTPYDLGWGDPRRGGFTTVAYDIGEGVRLNVRNADVGTVFAELVRRLMAAGWDGPADPIRDDWGYNPRLKRWAETAGYSKVIAPLSAWSDHAWATAIDLDTAVNPMLARRPADPWKHTNMPRSTSAIARGLGIEWGGDWSEPWDPQHFQIAMTPQQTRDMADRIRTAQEDDMADYAAQLDAIQKDTARTRALLESSNVAGRVTATNTRVEQLLALFGSAGVDSAKRDAAILGAIATLPKPQDMTPEDFAAALAPLLASHGVLLDPETIAKAVRAELAGALVGSA